MAETECGRNGMRQERSKTKNRKEILEMDQKRLGTTILCTLLLLRRRLIGFAVLEVILTGIMAAVNIVWHMGALPGILCEAVMSIFLFLTGMKLYENHTSFCRNSSVSKRNRILSGVAAVCAVSLISAVCLTAARIAVYGMDGFSASLAKFLRLAVNTSFFNASALLADGLELFFFLTAVVWFGYFLGALRQRIGSGKLLIILLVTALVLGGNIYLTIRTGTNILMWVFMPAAVMQRTRFRAMLFSMLLAVVFGFFGFFVKDEAGSEE